MSRRLLAGMFLPLFAGFVHAQAPTEDDCGANECFSPAFGVDIGIVYQPPVGQYGITELMYAVETDNLAKVESLLASGVDVDAQNDTGATALLMAAAYGSRLIVDRLLAAGADPNIISHRGDAPLASAIQFGHEDIAVALLKHGANPDGPQNVDEPRFRQGPLVKAAVLGQTDVVELLLNLDADTSQSGLEALNLALWKHHEDIVGLLVETDIDLNAPTYDATTHTHMQTGEFVLQTAAEQGLQLSTAMLLEKGADANARNVRGQSALFFAVRENHPAVVKLLLDWGAIVTGDDLASAFDTGDEMIANELAAHLDVSALEAAEIEMLIVRGDRTDNEEILDRLFSARDARKKSEAVTSLLFAKADTDTCDLARWDLQSKREETVFSQPGPCEHEFFFNRSRAELYAVGGHEVSVISLDAPRATPRVIKLPAAMIDEDLAALKERVNNAYENRIDVSWMTARVVQVGVIENGEFAFATHSGGPADETYGHLYAMTGDSWRLVRNEDCHRFDACRFAEILSHSIHERPGSMTIWSPEIRRNPYFVDKTESREIHYEDVSWNGIVTLDIDGQASLLHYGKSEGGHCMDDCTYTSSLTLELPDQATIPVAKFAGNNAIVDRYVLVRKQPWPRSELIDLGTGESVFGELQVAGWLH